MGRRHSTFSTCEAIDTENTDNSNGIFSKALHMLHKYFYVTEGDKLLYSVLTKQVLLNLISLFSYRCYSTYPQIIDREEGFTKASII